eukprot:TRINITY_DN8953_c0_g1_i1.p1 TRINITY_DN8953_c0_g1~~TRINITY_DN8953_c0_g1_i1.p1  ORF type:complete len:338 (+),score=115.08 TRINITY_DN8953_c0_g1_i1:106-1119(+)
MNRNSLLKAAAANTTGMPPPAPRRPPAPSGYSSSGAPPPAALAPVPASECFDAVRSVPVGDDGDVFQVYVSAKEGSEVTCVLVHGAGLCAMSWGLCAKHLKEHANVVAFDLRGHGATACADDTDLSSERLVEDTVALIHKVVAPGQKLFLMGHSLGGAVVVKVAHCPGLAVKPAGCIVVDVVEGTALESLKHMKGVLSRRPPEFADLTEVIRWGVSGAGVRNLPSACASMPPQVKALASGGYGWRTDLLPTERYWQGWFEGMSQAFLASPCPKLLLLAGAERLDKDLSIGHMQGKFQLTIVHDTGHFMQEDKPEELAKAVGAFIARHTKPLPSCKRS